MSDIRGKTSISKKINILQRQHLMCFWCNDHISMVEDSVSIDHVIPMSVYTCTKRMYNEKENKDFLESLRDIANIVVCCSDCNQNKASTVISKELVLSMGEKCGRPMNDCIKIYDKYQDRIDTYIYSLKRVCKEQGNLCAICGCRIDKDSVVLRCNSAGATIGVCVHCNRTKLKRNGR